jgi:hypothetical protein
MAGEKGVAEGRNGAAVSESGITLVRSRPSKGQDVVLGAAYSGKLLVDRVGCLRLEAHGSVRDYPHDYVPVWPARYSLDEKGNEVRILDEKGNVIGMVGKEVRVGGGEIKQDEAGPTPEARRNFEATRRRCARPMPRSPLDGGSL